jgi:subtilisin family serine protease
LICFSSGNSGNNGLTRPKGAKNIITTGNFENYRPADLFGCGENDADNINERYVRTCADSGTGASSIGNCGDGRVKPDVVAPGQWTASANSSVDGKPPGHSRYISAHCVYGGGTSAASPKTAGAAALIIQWWRQRHTVDAIQTANPGDIVNNVQNIFIQNPTGFTMRVSHLSPLLETA